MPVFFDAETDGIIEGQLIPNIHCICAYNSTTQTFTRFYEPEGGALGQSTLQKAAKFLCEARDELHGFNSAAFDLRLVYHHLENDDLKNAIATCALEHTDVMLDFWSRAGFPASLQSIATGIGAGSKLMGGENAIAQWQAGNIQNVLDYCDEDCKLLASIVEYVNVYGRYIRITKTTKRKAVTLVDDYTLRPTLSALDALDALDVSWMENPPKADVDWAIDRVLNAP